MDSVKKINGVPVGLAGVIAPAGGSAGDTMIKNSGTNFDFIILKNNLAAIVAPAVTNDSSEGYAIHSRWTDLATAKVYECVDASVGAAVWVDLTGGGGGGGAWEVIETRLMTGNVIELFDVGTDDVIKIECENIGYNGNDYPRIGLSIDGGLTYPVQHFTAMVAINSTNDTPTGRGYSPTNYWKFGLAAKDSGHHVEAILNNVTGSGYTYAYLRASHNDLGITFSLNGSGLFSENGVVNKIKVFSGTSTLMNKGRITLSKRLY